MSIRPTLSLSAGAKAAVSIGALGVVFGDIGTSPLYAFRECLRQANDAATNSGVLDLALRKDGVLGVLSLIVWALVFEVSFKYLGFVMRADNRGEGGIFALLALTHADRENPPRSGRPRGFTLMLLFGAALLYGDGVITPAISVLGAAEGFSSFSPRLTEYVPAIACVILLGLFWVQRKGTKTIGNYFGPIMVVWFTTLACLGVWRMLEAPEVLGALDPRHGLRFLMAYPGKATAILGSVILAITGAEALYADMGHFGLKAISRAWYFAALPGLVLNYFGQGAYALSHPASTEHPFFALAPAGAPRLALIGLSIAAAAIASQALISGVFSLTRQAIQLGYFPRLKVLHTNAEQVGQIYLPLVNAALCFTTLTVVLFFKSSNSLAIAYGVAVTGTMVVTTFAFYRVARRRWKWRLWWIVPLCALFACFDLSFFGANLHKFFDGGWLPIAIAFCVLAIMHTWKVGRDEIFRRVYGNNVTESELTDIARSKHVTRVGGGAVFMVGSPTGTPIALLHHVKANRCLHHTVVLLSIMTEEVPTVPAEEQLTLNEVGEGIWRAVGRYGYMESPDVSELMEKIKDRGVTINPAAATYFFNREMIISGGNSKMWEWQKSLYSFLSRNARPAKDYYQITPSQIIEMGLPLQL